MSITVYTSGNRKREVKLLPRNAWPGKPYRRPPQGPPPQFPAERRDHNEITAPRDGDRCRAIVGYADLPDLDVWAERRWSGYDIRQILCGRSATVDIGLGLCTEHGGEHYADRIRTQLRDATGRWDVDDGVEPDARRPFGELAELWERDRDHRTYYSNRGETLARVDAHFREHPEEYSTEDDEEPNDGSFAVCLLELGVRVVEPLWRLFQDEDKEAAA